MASTRALLLMAFAVIAGGQFMNGVNGDSAKSSFLRRRLTGHSEHGWSGAGATPVPAGPCPNLPCIIELPTCCQWPGIGSLPGPFSCVNTQIDILNCGACGTRCPVGEICCNGQCANILDDRNNCGGCGEECGWGIRCSFGFCNYT
ncbi:unnamed protein product [Calypogeia fissa]